MSQAKLSVFICPSCGEVVKSDRPLEEGVICGECLHEFGKPEEVPESKTKKPGVLRKMPKGVGEAKKSSVMRDLTAKKAERIKPVGVIEEPVIEAKPVGELPKPSGNAKDEEVILPDGSRRVRRIKKRPKKEKHKGLILFLLGWLSVIGIVFAFYQMQGKADAEEEVTEDKVKDVKEVAMKGEILRRFLPAASDGFKRFIFHPTNEGREQYIDNSADLARSFSSYYRLHSFPKPDSQLALIRYNVIALSKTDFGIETIWKDGEGRRIGGVHLWDGKGWKLDWENFAPYSTESWSRFRSKLGSKSGVFRLLVRKRTTANEDREFYLSFYRAPDFFEESGEFKDTESPEVRVETKSLLGKRFLKLWDRQVAGEAPFDSILGRSLDPENYMRITVELSWEKNEVDEDVMRMTDIRGVGWFGERVQAFHLRKQRELDEGGKQDEKMEEEPADLDLEGDDPVDHLDALVPSEDSERPLLPELSE